MAANRVFDVVELLEAILLKIPTQDLLSSQRLSRAFRDTIRSSVHLKRALYLGPCEFDELDPALHSFGGCTYVNSTAQLGVSRFPGRIELTFNPLLYERVDSTDPSSLKQRGLLRSNILLSSAERLSCDDMYFTQPPWDLSCDELADVIDPMSMNDAHGRNDYSQEVRLGHSMKGMKFGELRSKARLAIEQERERFQEQGHELRSMNLPSFWVNSLVRADET